MGVIYSMVEGMNFLDELINLIEQWNASCRLSNHVGAAPMAKEIYQPDGIKELADVLGKKLKREDIEMGADRLYFMYKGYMVYCYEGMEDE